MQRDAVPSNEAALQRQKVDHESARFFDFRPCTALGESAAEAVIPCHLRRFIQSAMRSVVIHTCDGMSKPTSRPHGAPGPVACKASDYPAGRDTGAQIP